jgi:SAM-dependent methyltransferase
VVIVGDMRMFTLAERFALIIAPFRAFLHNLTEHDQLACLDRVREHLRPGGCFAFNVYHPSLEYMAHHTGALAGVWRRAGTFPRADGGCIVRSESNRYDTVRAQSFHWFRTTDALSEFARILKERRRLAISWNRRSTSDPLTAGYRQAIVDVGGEMTPESRTFDPNVISDSGLFSSPERKSFPNFQRLDLAGLIGRARSASYVPKSGAAGERLLSLLRVLHERYADGSGFVTLVYDTEVFCSIRL